MKAPCTLKDLLPIEQAQQVVDWFDSRPLTDETLKELGFEKGGYKRSWWIYDNFPYSDLLADIKENKPNEYIVHIGDLDKPTYKTVGSVKMLIEALKGDE